jgi:hypothetical protein
MNYLALFNGLGKRVKPMAYRDAARLDERFQDNGMDSLDVIVLCIYACEVFGIPEEIGKNLNPQTYAELARFAEEHRTRTPASVDEALALVDG